MEIEDAASQLQSVSVPVSNRTGWCHRLDDWGLCTVLAAIRYEQRVLK